LDNITRIAKNKQKSVGPILTKETSKAFDKTFKINYSERLKFTAQHCQLDFNLLLPHSLHFQAKIYM